MRKAAIVQARTSSTRLPGKILKTLPFESEITVLEQVVKRLEKCRNIDDIVIATTAKKVDDAIVELAEKQGVRYFRGSNEDVLDRYYNAALDCNADIIVRITSDCPCIAPEIVDSVIKKHIETQADYTSNITRRTFPRGMDTEVVSFDTLELVNSQAVRKSEREHVFTFIRASKPESFKIGLVEAESVYLERPDVRLVLDEEKDYALLCAVYDYLYKKDEVFRLIDIIRLFNEKPWLKLINQDIKQKKCT